MIAYYLKLSIKSIRRTPILSALMVLALALGIGACMTTLTVYHLMSGNPIPHKSGTLFAVQMDAGQAGGDPTLGPEDVPSQLTYMDANNLLGMETPAVRQLAMFNSSMVIRPEDDDIRPFRSSVRATYGTFFSMFDVPFLFGTAWGESSDADGATQVVLTRAMNDRLFGGENSVGQRLRMDNDYMQVVGVVDTWQPTPLFYDLNAGSFSEVNGFFVPMRFAVQREMGVSNGNVNCLAPPAGDGYANFLQAECVWIQFWAELADEDAQAAYLDMLNGYAETQKQLGRFPRPINNFLSDVMQWMRVNEVVTTDNRVLVGLSFLFLAVCVINTIGLLLAKFVSKSSEVSVRRALGASRGAVFSQNLTEVMLVGVTGGLLGVAFAWLGLRAVEALYRGYERLVSLDITLMLMALGIALGASLVAGLYPTWRVARMAPATYLKTQ